VILVGNKSDLSDQRSVSVNAAENVSHSSSSFFVLGTSVSFYDFKGVI